MARTSASSKPLTDHDEIRRWAEERKAKPSRVSGTGNNGDVGMIRLDFPGYSGEGSLEEISWDEWFQKFDESNLALLVQEQTARGQKSNFNKLVSRDTAEQSETGGRSSGRASSASRSRATSASASQADEEELEASTDLDEDADADEELEEDLDVEEVTPVRASGAGNSRGRARQARTSSRRGSRAARSTASARQSTGQAGRSNSPTRTAAGAKSSKRTQATGGKRGSTGAADGLIGRGLVVDSSSVRVALGGSKQVPIQLTGQT
jgi:hypothetical protein